MDPSNLKKIGGMMLNKTINSENPWDIPLILELLQIAGEMSLNYWQKTDLHTEFKSDASPVTEADTAIEKMLSHYFDCPEKGIYLIGEETVETRDEAYIEAALNAPVTFVVDPIDGTAPFSNQLPMFGTAIGLMQHGKITHGAMIMPFFGEVYITDGKHVLYTHNHDMKQPLTCDALRPLIPMTPRDGMIAISQLMAKRGDYLGKERVQCICSCVYTIGNLLCGRYKAFIGSGKVWDYAFGMALLKQLHGEIYTFGGDKASENIHDLFQTQIDASNRWQLRQQLVFALSDEVAREVASRCRLDQTLSL